MINEQPRTESSIKGNVNWRTIGLFFLLLVIIAIGISGPCSTYKSDVTGIGSSGNKNNGGESSSVSPVTSPAPSDGASDVPITATLSWAVASGATHYAVYCGITTTDWYSITNTGLTNYNPGTLAYNTTYYWRIDPNNINKVTSGKVWSFTTIAQSINIPAQVTNPAPANGGTDIAPNVQLSWAAATDAASYDVYCGTANPPPFRTNTTSTTYNPGILTYSTIYNWRINSKNALGTTTGNLWNFTTRAQTPAPNTPSGLTAEALSSSQVVISWADNSGDETGFTIERKSPITGTYATVATPTANTTVYTDTNCSSFSTYYYRIKSFNAMGDSAYSNEASAVTFNRTTSGSMILQWKTEGANLRVRVSAPTTGWVSVGFVPVNKMQGANIIIGYVSGGTLFIQDNYGTGTGTHASDISLGGTDNITNKSGTEIGGVTELVFTIPLNSGDSRDKPLVVGNNYNVILGYSNSDNFTGMHTFAATINIKIQ